MLRLVRLIVVGAPAAQAGAALALLACPAVAQPVPPPQPAQVAGPSVAPAAEPARSWTDGFRFAASVDSYFAVNYRLPVPPAPGTTARAFDANNGFQLAAVGLDVSHEPSPVGGTVQLRFSPYAAAAYAGFDNTTQLQFVKQAFGSWRPGGKDSAVTLEFGKFDTLYGAEVFDSWQNPTYTRGFLFWLGQPLFHVGARADWQLSRELDAKLMIVNGWSQNADLNTGKSYGLQVNYARGDWLGLSLGWYGGPEQEDSVLYTGPDGVTARYRLPSNNERFRHLVDLVAKVAPSKAVSVTLNADWGTESVLTDPVTHATKRMSWYGAMLATRCALTDELAVALRGEAYADPQGYTFAGFKPAPNADGTYPNYLFETGTLTLEALPTPNLVLRLDNRIDVANEALFAARARDLEKTQVTTTLGVVVKTD